MKSQNYLLTEIPDLQSNSLHFGSFVTLEIEGKSVWSEDSCCVLSDILSAGFHALQTTGPCWYGGSHDTLSDGQ